MPIYDRLCKQFLLESLDPVSKVAMHMTVAPQDDQYVDNFCVPKPNPPPDWALAHLGPLRDMVREPCMIESSSRPPSPADLDNLQRKQLALQRQLIRENGDRYVKRPRLWMLSVGRPRQTILECRFEPTRGQLPGFYEVSPWLRMGLCVLSELPDTPDTLAVRLVGSKRQRKHAMEEVKCIPLVDPLRGPLLEIVERVRYFIEKATDVEVDAEERTIMTELGEQWLKYRVAEVDRQAEAAALKRVEAEVRERVEEEVRDEAAVEALQDGLLTVLRARHLPQSKTLAKRVKTCSDQVMLKRWLERAAVAKTSAEIFAEG
jgi:hypothetical protein